MTDQNTVRLTVDGRDFVGWKSVSITAGIERVARDFTLEVTDRWPAAGGAAVRQIAAGAKCELYIGSDKVLTGFVDATPVRYDASSVSVGVSGRSKTADLVDCACLGARQYRGQKLEAIAKALAAEYGVSVLASVDTGAAIADWQLDPTETVFEAIDKLLKPKQIWATDSPAGELVLIRVPGEKVATRIELGKNILECDAGLDFKDRFSEYIARGQAAGDDDQSGAAKTQISATSKDGTIKRKRVLAISMQGQATNADCKTRVEFEQAYRFAQSLKSTYTVQGWRDEAGQLWRPNTRVWVLDEVVGFDDELLITEVTYSLSNEGMRSVLTLAPASGYAKRDDDGSADDKKSRKGKDSKLPTNAEFVWMNAPK
ncbi:baseplate protein [Chitinibacter fontanus]|uniref:Baseplate protein n=1 Tax=Chitinibacter fontanus TaxID=1737446 RepID=A0A7D5ZB51_9NEIS|nr:baseplate protein [Chitinibacter fontanus]QLI80786.1 baseplate protein [Chitinibacter fontanus]